MPPIDSHAKPVGHSVVPGTQRVLQTCLALHWVPTQSASAVHDEPIAPGVGRGYAQRASEHVIPLGQSAGPAQALEQ